MFRLSCVSIVSVSLAASSLATAADPLAKWNQGVKVRSVTGETPCHTIHSYFGINPESPDGDWVLFYASTAENGQKGEVRIRHRHTGQERTLATGVTTEDAHRAACQQWVSNGRQVVYHDVRDGHWQVVSVDRDTGRSRVLAVDRQLGWGQPLLDLVPIYGCHWNPGVHRDLELVDLRTGEIRITATADGVRQKFPQWVAKKFGDRPISVFFPMLSPDGQRAFFKVATAGSGDSQSWKASMRDGIVCYDFPSAKFLSLRERWGHPAWHPDSRHILEVGRILIDSGSGNIERLGATSSWPGSHPCVSPDGQLFVTDVFLERMQGQKGEWGILVGSLRGTESAVIHRFDHSGGARSWRRAHPHPSFSADGRRIYFNTSSGPWTRLWVAEAAQ